MTIVLAHPSQSTLLTRRAGPSAAKRPAPPYWLSAWQRDPQFELEDLRTFYHRECTRAESIRRTVATRRKLAMRPRSPSSRRATQSQNQAPTDENLPAASSQSTDAPTPAPISTSTPTPAPSGAPLTPTQEKAQALLGMYSSLLESRLQSVERVSKMLSTWREHKPLPGP
ncbi:hypothetical protein FRC08_015298 [Ceratobasidium sp. 394]|nr:hypothetical protein FRC08_015298 [Ceratobasidium sp. 394]KAG9093190.1 hypothetical protein FS749_014875 [Ceratobasidium sp. UAMH 11750]